MAGVLRTSTKRSNYSLTLGCEKGVDLAGGFLLERREDVGIGVQGEADLGVP